ncbi:globin domain-containing protein [Kitasatospora brasiliensis]|uniref:globin domain-containing protein n=1 Tax=Kitasatospora brasiliensis TaxID=3058040 RepID=UPI00292F6211|nr:globin domain-containing protein [Kitasatospora sp. K002]
MRNVAERNVAVKSRTTVLVRSGYGAAGAASVPGLATDVPTAVLPPVSMPPLSTPPMSVPPMSVPSASMLEPVRPVLPARPAHPPTIPAPAPAPAHRPLFVDAPGLNRAGPGDRWSQAWGAPTPSAAPPAALPAGGEPQAPELTARDVELVRGSLAAVTPVADRATAHFFALLFLRHPELRSFFPAAMDVHRDRLFRTLLAVVRELDQPAALRATLTDLGRGHRRHGALAAHYVAVEECLVRTLVRYAGSRWDAEAEPAWRRAYRMIATTMIEAAEQDARTSPPWWQGEIVRHERRTRDVAVITVRPDQAYPFRAGQFTALETPWWPRVWRHYSFAAAPRPDGLLSFHVKAVPAGWVSNALVHRAAPGDVLRLGPAAGSMTVDHTAGADLLCLGGGTGIAPVRALVEEVAGHGMPGRRVEVFYGARRSEELYELDGLRELARRHPWLTVRPVVSGGAPGHGLPTGELPEVVGRFGPWVGRAAVLSGPPAMVRRGVGVLLRAGVPAELIRHDLVGDLASG